MMKCKGLRTCAWFCCKATPETLVVRAMHPFVSGEAKDSLACRTTKYLCKVKAKCHILPQVNAHIGTINHGCNWLEMVIEIEPSHKLLAALDYSKV